MPVSNLLPNRGADPRARRRGVPLCGTDSRRAQSGPGPCSGAERRGEALDEVSAAIPGDGVAGNAGVHQRPLMIAPAAVWCNAC